MTHPTNATRENTEEWVTLLNGLRVPEAVYQTVRRRVLMTVPTLEFNVDYLSKHVYELSYWECLDKGEKSVAGQVVKDLVLRRLVPLVRIKWAHEYPEKYRRI